MLKKKKFKEPCYDGRYSLNSCIFRLFSWGRTQPPLSSGNGRESGLPTPEESSCCYSKRLPLEDPGVFEVFLF